MEFSKAAAKIDGCFFVSSRYRLEVCLIHFGLQHQQLTVPSTPAQLRVGHARWAAVCLTQYDFRNAVAPAEAEESIMAR